MIIFVRVCANDTYSTVENLTPHFKNYDRGHFYTQNNDPGHYSTGALFFVTPDERSVIKLILLRGMV